MSGAGLGDKGLVEENYHRNRNIPARIVKTFDDRK
jgi:hypothetical protein